MIEESNLPKFLFVGTAKAGTTSLYHYLSDHPEIHIPIKETFYFIRDQYPQKLLEYPKQRKPETIIRSFEKYKDLYIRNADKVAGEIGTGYLYHSRSAIPEIKKTLGKDVKIVIILRDPVERTYSGYLHFKKFSFPMESIVKEIKKESEREIEGYDFMWQFSSLSYYFENVKAYMGAFENVGVFFYEDLKTEPKEFLKKLFSFIGVDPNMEIDLSKKFNPSGDPRSDGFQKFVTGDHWLKRLTRPWYHFILGKDKARAIRDKMRDSNIEKNELDRETRSMLQELFANDLANLRSLLPEDYNKIKDLWF